MCCQLEPHLLRKKWRTNPVGVKRQIAITLCRLGTCGELRNLAHLFGLAKCTVCMISNRVVRVINLVFKIKFPTHREIEEIAGLFYEDGGVPGCCGSLDGSHIPIIAPLYRPKDYFNRKQRYSIVLQAVVSATYKFINVNVGWPGCVHDARVLKNTGLFHHGQMGTLLPQSVKIGSQIYRPFLVADSAYPLLTWIMKPFGGGQLNLQTTALNQKLSHSRVKVEQAFGMLKGRFRCLLKENESALKNVVRQVLACCAIHNICIDQEDMVLDEWRDFVLLNVESESDDDESEDDDAPVTTLPSGMTATAIRESLLAFV
ncbi:uncharacterized protein LOC129232750 [Uloborus diversus]|uniref:uncharacterized protein LOC129232750 n=1 Tax=Uloborus diversus TaxID=327109 RepID=UPI00240A5EA9|nr:uncharacterized protein LOC129232750 [Uloborus diversus]